MFIYFLIALGGALGSIARFWCAGKVVERLGDNFPWGTLFVNVIGSFIIGALFALGSPSGRWLQSSEMRIFLMVGFCGGYTTFSAFSLQTIELMNEGNWLFAGMNVLGSVVTCFIATGLGQMTGHFINHVNSI